MPRISAVWRQQLAVLVTSKPYLMWILWASGAWSVCLAAFNATNSFGYVPPQRLVLAWALAPGILLVLAWGTGKWLAAPLRVVPMHQRGYWLLVSLAVAGIIFWHYPPPPLALPAEHVLQISATSRQNPDAAGAKLEILRLRYLDGQRVAPEDVQLEGAWTRNDQGAYITNGLAPARLELRSVMPGGVAVLLRYNQIGGIAQVAWDGTAQEIDTFSWYATSSYTAFETDNPGLANLALMLLWNLVYFSALFCLVLWVVLVLRLVIPQPKWERLARIAVMLLVLAIFVWLKLNYQHFNDVRNLRDTYSYVATASEPLFSSSFWLGERAFTIPLFHKIVGVNIFNYHQPEVMWRLADIQCWFSVFAWTVLAAVVASRMRHPWVGVFSFALVLLFSANLEISMWDLFLLSESLSFSLFALLVALWIVTFDRWFPARGNEAAVCPIGWLDAVLLFGMLLVTVLFSFARDTNLYLITCVSLTLFGLGGMVRRGGWRRRLGSWHLLALVYLGLVGVLFVVQPMIVDRSGRWQVHLYDHLGRRLLSDPKAVAYLQDRGLPVTDALLNVTQLTGPEYRAYLKYAQEMQPVRAWLETKGRSAYVGYLLAHPLETLWTPIAQVQMLLNGSSVEYRYPKYSVLPVPPRIQDLTEKYYPHTWLGLLPLVAMTILSLFVARQKQDPGSAFVWLMLGFWISVYPLMGIVWHGNPLEPERHAGQIGIMIRLAGWLSLPLVLNAWLSKPGWRKFWQIDSAVSRYDRSKEE